MDDVAARAGVSRALVSLVMQDSPRVSETRRRLVLEAAAELGYRPNRTAQNLARGRTDTIGVMLNDVTNPFFTGVAQGIANAAADHHLQVLINSGWSKPQGEVAAIEALVDLQTDGLALCAPRLPIDVVTEVAARTPVIGVSVYGSPPNLDTVGNDERRGAQVVVEHLVELGHRRIAHVSAEQAAGGPERCQAFVEAMAAAGLEPILVEGDFNYDAGLAAADALVELADRPTAVLAANDLVAVGVITRLTALGVRVPEELSVVGYDDTLLASVGTMPLTTVHQPRGELGRRGLDLLRSRIAGRTETIHELVEPRLVVRRSTGPAASR
jgi:DNA-binding LacI/PurR family transcriptional regulator